MKSSEFLTEERLLKVMVRIRMVEEAIADKYHEENMRCPIHLSIGQEAPAAAFSLVTSREDYAVSTHRAHAHFLAKGGDLNSLIAELYGRVSGCSKGAGGSMHLADISQGFMGSSAIVGNSIPVGVGLGLALKLRAREHVSWVFLGDAATEEGVYYEAMNFAVLKSLPVIFMCENNHYSVYSDDSVRRPNTQRIFEVARALGAQSRAVNGNDAVESLQAVKWARKEAREGPVLLELETFRQREHCGPNYDDSLGYRPQLYIQQGMASDPIVKLRESLDLERRAEWLSAHEDSVREEIRKAFVLAESAEYLSRDNAAGLVYA